MLIRKCARNKRHHLLLKHPVQERRLQQPPLGSHVRLLAALVLRRQLHPLAPHRSYRQTPAPALHDFSHGSRHGRTGCPRLSSPVQDFGRVRGRYCRCGHVVLIRRCFHHRLPGYGLGLPVRDPAVETEAEGIEYLDGGELDL